MAEKLEALKKMKPSNEANQHLVDICIDKLEYWIKVQAKELDQPDWVKKKGAITVQKIIKYWVLVLRFICEQMGVITKELSCSSRNFVERKLILRCAVYVC